VTFDEYFRTKVLPTLPGVPVEAIPLVRAPLVACWNAALDAAQEATRNPDFSSEEALAQLRALEVASNVGRT
jgi:hypothetical protein